MAAVNAAELAATRTREHVRLAGIAGLQRLIADLEAELAEARRALAALESTAPEAAAPD